MCAIIPGRPSSPLVPLVVCALEAPFYSRNPNCAHWALAARTTIQHLCCQPHRACVCYHSGRHSHNFPWCLWWSVHSGLPCAGEPKLHSPGRPFAARGCPAPGLAWRSPWKGSALGGPWALASSNPQLGSSIPQQNPPPPSPQALTRTTRQASHAPPLSRSTPV